MRSKPSLVLVLVTSLLTLLVEGRSGCNPFHSTSRTAKSRRGSGRGSRAQESSADAIRFDEDLVTHYAPDENLERLDTALIGKATRSLDVAAYSLTDFALQDALIEAAQRGVAVRIYVDKEQSAGERKREGQSVLKALAETPHIQILVKHSTVLMHLKSYAVDGAVLRSGSANFSPTGEKRQDNDLTVTRNPIAVSAFERHFEEMWSRKDNEPLP